jgi:hypothetical protein
LNIGREDEILLLIRLDHEPVYIHGRTATAAGLLRPVHKFLRDVEDGLPLRVIEVFDGRDELAAALVLLILSADHLRGVCIVILRKIAG